MTLLSEAQRTYKDLADIERDLRLFDEKDGLTTRIDLLSFDERTVLGLLHIEELTCDLVARIMTRTVEEIVLLRASALSQLNSGNKPL